MYTEISTQEEVTQHTAQGATLLIFINPNGNPCKSAVSQALGLEEKYEGKLEIIINDITKSQDLAAEFGIRMLPSTFYYSNGKVKGQTVGPLDEDLIAHITK